MIMTIFQEEMLKQFDHLWICIEGTNVLNTYSFNLYTLVTIDEFEKGVPVTSCISNRGDIMLFQKFYLIIKGRVGIIST